MQSRASQVGLLAALAAVVVIMFIVLSGGNDSGSDNGNSTTAGGGPVVIKIANGAPVGGVRDLTYSQGDQVRLTVFPDPDVVEIHVHGYDFEKETHGTTPVNFSFPAKLAGGFEVEAHTANGEFQIADMTVNP